MSNYPSLSEIQTGSYTPDDSLSNNNGLTSYTLFNLNYVKVGNIVEVFGKITIEPTAIDGALQLEFSLPFPTDLQTNSQLAGQCSSALGDIFSISTDLNDDLVRIAGVPRFSIVSTIYTLNFKYVLV